MTGPVRAAKLVPMDDVLVKQPRGQFIQMVAIQHRMKRATSALSGQAAGRAAIIIPVPPGTHVKESDYPMLFWHLERMFEPEGDPPVTPQGQHDSALMSRREVRERWGEVEHPLAGIYDDPPFLVLVPKTTHSDASFIPVVYTHELLPNGNLYLPVALHVLRAEIHTDGADEDDLILGHVRRRCARQTTQINYTHRIYVINCQRVIRNALLKAARWNLTRADPEIFWSSVESDKLPDTISMGEIRSVLRLRPTQQWNSNIEL